MVFDYQGFAALHVKVNAQTMDAVWEAAIILESPTFKLGLLEGVIMNCEDAANSQPLKSACVCISTIKRAAKETFHSLWVVFGLGLDLHTNKNIEKAMAWGWERSTVLLLLYLLYRMTPEMFLSHSHHALFVWLAQAAVSVACFC